MMWWVGAGLLLLGIFICYGVYVCVQIMRDEDKKTEESLLYCQKHYGVKKEGR